MTTDGGADWRAGSVDFPFAHIPPERTKKRMRESEREREREGEGEGERGKEGEKRETSTRSLYDRRSIPANFDLERRLFDGRDRGCGSQDNIAKFALRLGP